MCQAFKIKKKMVGHQAQFQKTLRKKPQGVEAHQRQFLKEIMWSNTD